MTLRSCLRAAAVCASVPLVLLSASPAFAYTRDDGDDPGPGLSVLETIAIYVGIPVLVFLLISLLVYAPSLARGPRYRPGLSWWAAPTWFNGPSQSSPAALQATPATPTHEATATIGSGPIEASVESGGASARW